MKYNSTCNTGNTEACDPCGIVSQGTATAMAAAAVMKAITKYDKEMGDMGMKDLCAGTKYLVLGGQALE